MRLCMWTVSEEKRAQIKVILISAGHARSSVCYSKKITENVLREWRCILLALTLDKQVTGRADSSRLIGSCAGEAAAVFSECFTDHQSGKSTLVGDLEINGALNLVVLSEPHNDGGGLTADLALQGHRLALDHIRVLQSLHKKYHNTFTKRSVSLNRVDMWSEGSPLTDISVGGTTAPPAEGTAAASTTWKIFTGMLGTSGWKTTAAVSTIPHMDRNNQHTHTMKKRWHSTYDGGKAGWAAEVRMRLAWRSQLKFITAIFNHGFSQKSRKPSREVVKTRSMTCVPQHCSSAVL